MPRIAYGNTVIWTYEVTNTGGSAISESEIVVTDSQPGVVPILDTGSDDGDMLLSWGETWIYTATAQALNLDTPPGEITVVQGCNTNRNTYQNTGRIEVIGAAVFDEDVSHYCNPIIDDSDNDGVHDDQDNCILKINTEQQDTDNDGHGNICDADFDQSCIVDMSDLSLFKQAFFGTDPVIDMNSDGVVNVGDLSLFKNLFFAMPGPSAAGSLCNP